VQFVDCAVEVFIVTFEEIDLVDQRFLLFFVLVQTEFDLSNNLDEFLLEDLQLAVFLSNDELVELIDHALGVLQNSQVMHFE
jgi:hypothetical protein